MSHFELVVKLFLQLFVILLTCYGVSALGRKYFFQTSVVSEMIAGVCLGPSFLGLIAPHFQSWLFPTTPLTLVDGTTIPHQSMSILFALSQVGIVLYMFFIGLGLNLNHVRKNLKNTGTLTLVGTVLPFLLGAAYVPFIYHHAGLFQPQITLPVAMMFMGVALSITAFPMLARMLYESGIAHTSLGSLIISTGALIDVLAWCSLAVIVALVQGNHYFALITILGAMMFALLMMTVGHHFLAKLAAPIQKGEALSLSTLAIVLSVIMLSAWFTDFIGVYGIFGAFITGMAMPRGRFATELGKRIEYLTTAFLLPIFFVFSGLNTQIALIDNRQMIIITTMIVILACVGKGLACALVARLQRESWRDATIIGVLLNSRGLMELIVLNVGLEYNIISTQLFTMLVVMAIITTVVTSPIYNYLTRKAMVEC